MIGQRLLHYQILEKLGEGGMGVVYKARDTHLDRFVAIKVLPPDKVADPSRRARFVQEAKAASALNHPNIITIYDISSDRGHDFIAMEYVAGKTLDQLIPRKGMRLNDALKIAVQIADALTRAHAAGIVHRDIKPANIMVDAHGQVKVLDFGLAKLTEQGTSENDSTVTIGVRTDEGAIVGTAAYMSPEQAEGKPLDARSDIFSFGAVLYEMVSGRRAFQGDSKMSVLSAVLHREPPELSAEIPHDLHKLIARCLRKDPSKRFQHADDLQVALGEIREESESGKLPSVPSRRPNRTLLLLAAGSLVAILAAGWWAWRFFRTAQAPLAFREIPFTSEPGYEMYPSFSPDGLALVYQQMPPPVDWGAAAPPVSIMVKMTGADSAAVLKQGGILPVHSPDGRWIAFGIRTNWFQPSPTTIAVMPRTGGAERRIAEVHPGFVPTPPVWTPDSQGLITMDREQPASPYHLVYIRLETGEKRRLTQPPSGLIGDYEPALSPDGRTLAFSRRTGSGLGDLTLLPLDGSFQPAGEPRKLETGFLIASWPVWTNDGKEIVFCSGTWSTSTLWRIRADGSGSSTRLPFGAPGAFQPAISPAGNRLAYIRHTWDSDIWRVELLPSGLPARQPEKFITSSQGDAAAVWSPDGRHIAFVSLRAGLSHPWIVDASGANPRQLTSVGSHSNIIIPSWSSDSQWIAFAANSEGNNNDVYIVGPRGGAPRNLTSHPADDINVRWSPDGRFLFFDSNRAGEYRPWKVSRDGGEASPAPDAPRGQVDASNAWRYYTRRDSGRLAIWREPAAGGQPERLVDNAGESAFALGLKGLYFVPSGPDANPYYNNVSFYDFATRRVTKVADLNSHLGILAHTRPALSPDGRYLLYALPAYETNDIVLVENFR